MKHVDKPFYTIQEFANFVGVHYNTIYHGIKKGHIEAFKVGRGKNSSYRIAHSEIQRMGLFHLDEVIDKIIELKLKERDERVN
jgi:excisionase family DNA binding protein